MNTNFHEAAEPLIRTTELYNRIRELGENITKDYKDKNSLICICILKGAYMFTCDLTKHIELPLSVEFISISSYGTETFSSGHVKLQLDLTKDIEGKHVLIIEDIIDTGLTIKYLMNLLSNRNPASIRVCSLLKKLNSEVKVQLDYIGFEIPKDAFVIGYGLDFAEQYRNLNFIGVLKKEYYIKKEELQINV